MCRAIRVPSHRRSRVRAPRGASAYGAELRPSLRSRAASTHLAVGQKYVPFGNVNQNLVAWFNFDPSLLQLGISPNYLFKWDESKVQELRK